MPKETEEKVPNKLVSAITGRKIPWFIKKIASLEAKVTELGGDHNGNGSVEADTLTSNRIFADGFVGCMHTFQIHNKAARRQIHIHMTKNGPSYARRIKGSKFRGFTI